MAFSESLAWRVRQALGSRSGVVEKKLFGGLGFLLNGNLSVGIWKQSLIVRLDPAMYEDALGQEHVRDFDITGRPMRGWVLVEPDGLESDQQLSRWINLSTEYVATLPVKDKSYSRKQE